MKHPASVLSLLVLSSLLGAASLSVQAQEPQEGRPAAGDVSVCRGQVSRFEEALGFIRDAQGQRAAAQLKERLLPAKLEGELLASGGYCGLAQYLRDKRLI